MYASAWQPTKEALPDPSRERHAHVPALCAESTQDTARRPSAQVFPQLYLPVMAEGNLRAIRPWRQYLPLLPAFWAFRVRMRRLNSYLQRLLRARWGARHRMRPPGAKLDILDRLFMAIEVRRA